MLLLMGGVNVRSQPAECIAVSSCREKFMPGIVAPGSSETIRSLKESFEAAKVAEQAELDARRALEDLKISILGHRAEGGKERQELFRNADYLRLMKECQAAIKKNHDAHNSALHGVVAAYGIAPPVKDFRGDSRAALNTTAVRWFPRYSQREIYDPVSRTHRRRDETELTKDTAENSIITAGRRMGGSACASTLDNGEILMYSGCFKSPEELAITIYHETSHWIDTAAKPGGFSYSDMPAVRYLTEHRAYENSVIAARKLGVDASEYVALARQYGMQAKIAGERNLDWDHLPADWISRKRPGRMHSVSPADPESGNEDELRRGLEAAERIVERDRNNREIYEEMQRQASLNQPVPLHPTGQDGGGPATLTPERVSIARPVPLNESRPSAAPMFMLIVAQKACSTMPQAFEADLRSIPWSQVAGLGGLEKYESALPACELRVYRRLIEFGRSWSAGMMIVGAEVRAAAAEPYSAPSQGGVIPPNQNHDPVRRRVNPLLPR